MQKLKNNLRNNLGQGLLTTPFKATLKPWLAVPALIAIAVLVGFSTALLKFDPISLNKMPILLFILFFFPSLFEELFFRGILISRDIVQRGCQESMHAIVISTIVFVLWHPVNALAFNHTAIPLFLNPFFLIIVAALGITCAYSYVVSRSIWVPVIIHWITVAIWILFLGGQHWVLGLS